MFWKQITHRRAALALCAIISCIVVYSLVIKHSDSVLAWWYIHQLRTSTDIDSIINASQELVEQKHSMAITEIVSAYNRMYVSDGLHGAGLEKLINIPMILSGMGMACAAELESLLSSETDQIRYAAFATLCIMGSEAVSDATLSTALSDDHHMIVREALLHMQGWKRCSSAMIPLLKRLLEGGSPDVKCFTLRVIESVGSDGSPFLDHVAKLAKDNNDYVRRCAEAAVNAINAGASNGHEKGPTTKNGGNETDRSGK